MVFRKSREHRPRRTTEPAKQRWLLWLAVGIALSGLLNLLLLSGTFYAQHIYDEVLPRRDLKQLCVLTGLVMLGHGAFVATDIARACSILRWGDRLQREIDRMAFDAARIHRDGTPLRWATSTRRVLASGAVAALLDGVWIPAYAVAAFCLHPALALYALASVVMLIAFAMGGEAALRGGLDRLDCLARRRLTLLTVTIGGGRSHPSARRWDQVSAPYFEQESKTRLFSLQLGAAAKGLRLMLQSGGLATGTLLVIAGTLSVGGLITSTLILWRVFASLDQVLAHWRHLAAAREGIARLAPFSVSHPGDQILNSSMLAKAVRRASDQDAESFLKYSSSWPMRFSRRTSSVSRS